MSIDLFGASSKTMVSRKVNDVGESVRRKVCEKLQAEFSGEVDFICKSAELLEKSRYLQGDLNRKVRNKNVIIFLVL